MYYDNKNNQNISFSLLASGRMFTIFKQIKFVTQVTNQILFKLVGNYDEIYTY